MALLRRSTVMLAMAAALLGPSPAGARRATCDDIAAAQASGLSEEQIKNDLATTSARVKACANSAKVRAQQDSRRARRAEHRQQRLAR